MIDTESDTLVVRVRRDRLPTLLLDTVCRQRCLDRHQIGFLGRMVALVEELMVRLRPRRRASRRSRLIGVVRRR